jgi:hypothetical protein
MCRELSWTGFEPLPRLDKRASSDFRSAPRRHRTSSQSYRVKRIESRSCQRPSECRNESQSRGHKARKRSLPGSWRRLPPPLETAPRSQSEYRRGATRFRWCPYHVISYDVVATDPSEKGSAGAEIQGRICNRRSCQCGDRGERQPRQGRNRKAASQPKGAASHRRVFLEPFFRCQGERYSIDLPFLDAVGDEKRLMQGRVAIRTEDPI